MALPLMRPINNEWYLLGTKIFTTLHWQWVDEVVKWPVWAHAHNFLSIMSTHKKDIRHFIPRIIYIKVTIYKLLKTYDNYFSDDNGH